MVPAQVAEAVHYFGKAQRTNHGVRLAKQHGMDTELLELALKVCRILASGFRLAAACTLVLMFCFCRSLRQQPKCRC